MANRDGFIMGRSDAPLTLRGIETARRLSGLIASEGVERIFTSSLGRAAFTASIYSEALRIPLAFREEMAELACGSWEGRSRADALGASQLIRSTWTARPPGGESFHDAEARVGSMIDEILGRENHGTVLVVAHASVNRVFLKLWLDLDHASALWVRSPHDTIYCIDEGKNVRYRSSSGPAGTGLLSEPE